MEQMTEAQFQAWILAHKGERGRQHNKRTIQPRDEYGRPTGESREEIESTTVVAMDGAQITVRRTPNSGDPNAPDYDVEKNIGPPVDTTPDRTPSQEALTQAQATKAQQDAAREAQEDKERQANATTPDEFGDSITETNLERAKRVIAKRESIKQQEVQNQQIASSQAATKAAQDRLTYDREHDIGTREDAAANRGLTQQQIDIQRQNADREARKPTYLSQADSKTPNLVSSVDGQLTTVANPNYDAVKAAAEEKRAEFASEIAGRRMTLDEAQAQYTQWFDTNVKGPLMLAQEARAKAEEQRQALDAEERRKQFAADFGLRKATLGESASQRATNAEISLLPYRAGPTESAEMSSAINSLAAGGRVGGPDASAGVHFTAGAFQFAAPDFDKIAKNAAHQVLSGLTDYRPSSQSYATGDYSGVPAVNLSGAPSMPAVGAPYQYTPTPLPAPSPGNVQ